MENAVTPAVQTPVFLVLAVVLSLAVLVYSARTRQRFAYELGPILGRTAATIASWIPIAISGVGLLYFASKLLLG